MEAVGQLDEDDPHVLRHGQEHLADVLGLLLLVAQRAELGELGDPVDQPGDVRPEPLLEVAQVVFGVLRDVVQQGGRDGHRVDAQLGQDLGRRDRVGDVGLAGGPLLPFVRLGGELVGALDRCQVGLRVVLVERRVQMAGGGLEGPRLAGRRGSGGARRSATALDRRRSGRIDGHAGQCTPGPRRSPEGPQAPGPPRRRSRHSRRRYQVGSITRSKVPGWRSDWPPNVRLKALKPAHEASARSSSASTTPH